MKIILKILLVGLFLFYCVKTYPQSQKNELAGIITCMHTGEPISFAEVRLQPGNFGVITGEDGSFKFSNILPGNYTLHVNFVGYRTLRKNIWLSGDYYRFLELELEREIKSIEGVEIIGIPEDHLPYNRSRITAETIQKMPARDIGDFLRSEPNISGVRKGATNIDPVIRGMKAGQLNVQANSGHKIEGGCPNRMDPATSHFDSNDITGLEVFKGPYALRFGPVFGGVLNIETKKAAPYDDFRIKARAIKGWESNWGGNKEHVTVSGGNRQIYFALTGNNQNYGNYKDGNGEEVKSSFRKYNYSAEVGISPLLHHEVRMFYKGSHGRDIHFPALAMDEREDNTQLASVGYHYKHPSNKVNSLDVKVYRSEVYHEMDNKWRPFSDTVVAVSVVDALTRGGRADIGLKLNSGTLHTGFDYEHIYKDGNRTKNLIMQPGFPVKLEPLWQNATIQNFGIFAEYNLKASDRVRWIFAGRVDRNRAASDPMTLENMMGNPFYYNDTTDSEYLNFSFSAGVSYNLSETFSIDLAIGRGVRNPDMVERFIILLPVGFDRYDYLGNPQLKPESNHQADLTLRFNPENFGAFSATGFFAFITDYVTGTRVPPSVVKPQTAGVLGVKRFINVDHALLYGFEFLWRSPLILNWGANLSVSYTAGINPDATQYIVENGEVVNSRKVKNDPLPEIPPMEAGLKFYYNLLNQSLVPELNIRMVAAQSRISAAYDEEATQGFAIAGVNVLYKYNRQVSLAAGVNNIFDKAYYEHLNRRMIGSTRSLYEPGRIFYLNVILNL